MYFSLMVAATHQHRRIYTLITVETHLATRMLFFHWLLSILILTLPMVPYYLAVISDE